MEKFNTHINIPLTGGEVTLMLVLAGSVVVTMNEVITEEVDCGSILSVIQFTQIVVPVSNNIIKTTVAPAKFKITINEYKDRINLNRQSLHLCAGE